MDENEVDYRIAKLDLYVPSYSPTNPASQIYAPF